MEKEALEWGGGCPWVLARSSVQDGGRRKGQSGTGPLGNSRGAGGGEGYTCSRSGFVTWGPLTSLMFPPELRHLPCQARRSFG